MRSSRGVGPREWLAIVLVGAFAIVGVGAFLVTRSDIGASGDVDASRSAAPPAAPAAAAPKCGAVLARRIRRRKTCRTSTATVTVAPMQKPVLLGEIDVRVYRAELDDNLLTLRVRTRNNFDKRDLVATASQRQFWVSANGTKVYASFPRAVIERQTTEVMDLEFALDRAQIGRIKARRNVADLTVVPLTQVDKRTPDRLGLVRLQVSSV